MLKVMILANLLALPVFAQAPAGTSTHSAVTPTHRLGSGWWKKRHAQKSAAAKKLTRCDLLFLGDSITHSWENAGKKVWKKYYSKRHAFNIGFSGDRTQHLLWRLDHGEFPSAKPKVAVVMIGTNNTGQALQKATETAEGIKAVINKIHQLSPDTQILLLGIFPRDEKPTDKMRMLNTEINKIIKTYDNGKSVHYLDISSAFLTPDGILTKQVMPDLLHPNTAGYKIWAEAMEPTLKKLLAD